MSQTIVTLNHFPKIRQDGLPEIRQHQHNLKKKINYRTCPQLNLHNKKFFKNFFNRAAKINIIAPVDQSLTKNQIL
jgi:hypothetical protein